MNVLKCLITCGDIDWAGNLEKQKKIMEIKIKNKSEKITICNFIAEY